MNEKIKKFVYKHKVSIALAGGAIVGIAVTSIIYKITKKELVKVPEWVDAWKAYCDKQELLYESGLPIFANVERTKIFRDAIEESAIPEFLTRGYEIVERGTF